MEGVLRPRLRQDIVRKTQCRVQQDHQRSDMSKRMIEFGFEPVGGPPESLANSFAPKRQSGRRW